MTYRASSSSERVRRRIRNMTATASGNSRCSDLAATSGHPSAPTSIIPNGANGNAIRWRFARSDDPSFTTALDGNMWPDTATLYARYATTVIAGAIPTATAFTARDFQRVSRRATAMTTAATRNTSSRRATTISASANDQATRRPVDGASSSLAGSSSANSANANIEAGVSRPLMNDQM